MAKRRGNAPWGVPSSCYVCFLQQFDASFDEVAERFAFQHAVLQQCQVDELFNNLVVVGKASVNIVLLRFQRLCMKKCLPLLKKMNLI